MGKKSIAITEDTIIQIGKSMAIGHYIDYFRQLTGKELPNGEHNIWLKAHIGKPIKEALVSYRDVSEPKKMEQKLSEERFDNMPDKKFIIAFDKLLEDIGYDYGGGIGEGYGWGKYMIIYGKTGTKSRPCPVRIYINDDGTIYFRLFLTKVDKHMKYIENSPAHIKNAFTFEGGDCKSCNTSCSPGKIYTIDGQLMCKCNHSTFYFHWISIDILPDIMELLAKFYPVKKQKTI